MSFNEVLRELSAFTVDQRQMLIRRALELNQAAPRPGAGFLTDSRISTLPDSPVSTATLEEVMNRLRARQDQQRQQRA